MWSVAISDPAASKATQRAAGTERTQPGRIRRLEDDAAAFWGPVGGCIRNLVAQTATDGVLKANHPRSPVRRSLGPSIIHASW
jgi:hypothetical protein